MHILTTTAPIILDNDYTIAPGEYALEDIASAQFLMLSNGGSMTPLTERRPFDETKDWNGKRILFSRLGGLGDLVLLTPILREIKKRWPKCVLHVASIKEFSQALMHLPYVDELIASPVSMAALAEYDCWVFLENVIERGPGNADLHSVDLVANHIGLTGEYDKRQDYRVTMRENIWAQEAYPRKNGVRRICIQLVASAPSRTYSQQTLGNIVSHLLKNGWEVMLMDRDRDLKIKAMPNLHVLASGFNFRQRCAVIANSDIVLAPDSSLAHIAGALEIPCIALFSVFKWQQRTKYSPTTVGINAVGDCAPCNHHPFLNHDFPDDKPCSAKGFCVPLSEIKPERILSLIETNHKGFKLQVVDELPVDAVPVEGANGTAKIEAE